MIRALINPELPFSLNAIYEISNNTKAVMAIIKKSSASAIDVADL